MAKPYRVDSLMGQGMVHEINGEERFIPDDPMADPAADSGPGEAFKVGMGNALLNVPNNIKAALDTARGKENTEAQQNYNAVKDLLAPLREDHGFAVAAGEATPGFLLPASRAAQAVGGAIEGAALNPDRPVASALMGAMGGAIGGDIGARLGARQLARTTGPAGRLAAQGVPTTLFQRTGSEVERAIESGLQAIPVLSSWASKPVRAQQQALNRGAASVFGYEGALTAEGLGNIKFGIQKKFQEVQNNIPDQAIPDELLTKVDNAGAMSDASRSLYDEVGVLDGEALMEIRTNLNNDMADAFINADRKTGRALQSTLNEVDEIINSSFDGRLVEQWSTARKEWQFLTALTKGKAISGDGQVNLNSMNTALRSIYPNFRFGDDLPGTAVGFGQLVTALNELPKALQSSGSAERAAAAVILTGGAKPTGGASVLIPTLAAARAAGQRGTDVGGVIGFALAETAAQKAGASNEQDPILQAVQTILEAGRDEE